MQIGPGTAGFVRTQTRDFDVWPDRTLFEPSFRRLWQVLQYNGEDFPLTELSIQSDKICRDNILQFRNLLIELRGKICKYCVVLFCRFSIALRPQIQKGL